MKKERREIDEKTFNFAKNLQGQGKNSEQVGDEINLTTEEVNGIFLSATFYRFVNKFGTEYQKLTVNK